MTFSANDIVAIIASGLVSGSLYALMASGLSLVWGTLGMFNFAYGTLVMLGAYAAWYFSDKGGLGAGLFVGILAAILVCSLAGYVLFVLLVKPFVGTKGADLTVIITTIAASSFLQNGVQEVFGPRYKQLERVLVGKIQILNTAIGLQEVGVIVLAPTILLILAFFLKRSKLGLAIRAVAQNYDSALLAGINVRQVYPLTFIVSSILAAVAGVMLGGLFFIIPTMGGDPQLRAFVVVVFGGLGSLPGTIIGAYIIGLIESTSAFVLSLYWAPIVLFAVLIIMMIVKPTGLLGGKQ
jgi:branched-chain amino acid transport system permease protein